MRRLAISATKYCQWRWRMALPRLLFERGYDATWRYQTLGMTLMVGITRLLEMRDDVGLSVILMLLLMTAADITDTPSVLEYRSRSAASFTSHVCQYRTEESGAIHAYAATPYANGHTKRYACRVIKYHIERICLPYDDEDYVIYLPLFGH